MEQPVRPLKSHINSHLLHSCAYSFHLLPQHDHVHCCA